jgi:hypothetical protein
MTVETEEGGEVVPVPVSLEMTVCELVVIEQGTERASKVNSFNDLSASHFPFDPGRFFVFAILTGSQGEGDLMLVVTHLPTDQEIYALLERIELVDRFEEVWVAIEPSPFAFPLPGEYLFTLSLDGDWVAHRRVHVY